MKTNKINVVLSLNKTVVTRYHYGNNNDEITQVSGAKCAGGPLVKVTKHICEPTTACQISDPCPMSCAATTHI